MALLWGSQALDRRWVHSFSSSRRHRGPYQQSRANLGPSYFPYIIYFLQGLMYLWRIYQCYLCPLQRCLFSFHINIDFPLYRMLFLLVAKRPKLSLTFFLDRSLILQLKICNLCPWQRNTAREKKPIRVWKVSGDTDNLPTCYYTCILNLMDFAGDHNQTILACANGS